MRTEVAVTGRIVKATGGFYYVDTAYKAAVPTVQESAAPVQCRGRGLLRREGTPPLVGDIVTLAAAGGSGVIQTILPRKNELIRPPLANLDRMVLILSLADPPPNLTVADTYLALLAHRAIPAHIALTKTDLADASALGRLYTRAGYPVYIVGPGEDDPGLWALREALREGVSAFCGNSGAGKSTLLNRIDTRLRLGTGQTSRKLGRGRHTTRHVELLALEGGGLVADTPGFSSLEMLRMGAVPKAALAGCFPEFTPYIGSCRFADCAHTRETGCAVLEAVRAGAVDKSRHESYDKLYAQAKAYEAKHR